MATKLEVITRGEVVHRHFWGYGIKTETGDTEHIERILEDYVGQWVIISLEKEDEEPSYLFEESVAPSLIIKMPYKEPYKEPVKA